MEARQESGVRDESWFIEQLEADPMPLAALLVFVNDAAERGERANASAMAKLFQDALAETGRVHDALGVLGLRAGWMEREADARALVKREAAELLGPDPRAQECLKHAGVGGAVGASEAVRRLRVLRKLREGTLCYDRTWGFGVIAGVDAFERRVEIDFETKRGHRMTFAYAAETLQLIGEEHLLARRHRDPEGMAACVQNDPAQVVRWALESFGPLPAAILQERLSPRLVPPDDWKRFWAAARKELKKDPLVHLPAKRSEVIELRERAEDFGPSWVSTLSAERDMERILQYLENWISAGAAASAPETARRAAAERLAFVVKGAGRRRPELAARAAVLADACGAGEAGLDLDALAARLAERDMLTRAATALSVKDRKAFLGLLHRRTGDAFLDILLSLLPAWDLVTFSDAMEILLGAGRTAVCEAAIKQISTQPEQAPEALLWLVRNPGFLEKWAPESAFEWVRILLNALECEQNGDRLKAQNALRERISRVDWMGAVFDRLTASQRREVLLRLRESPAWEVLERQALVGLLIKRFPELEAAINQGGARPGGAPDTSSPVTSLRSYEERQRQLSRLITEEIPRNSREIGLARSYGDLRENFEYKAAKDMQGLLMRRRSEWEQQLHEVRPTDFADYPTDRAGPGTGVQIVWPGGQVETYYLLGLWDQDEDLHIISSAAQLAEALRGHAPGDEVDLPDGQGMSRAKLLDVTPLPEKIQSWIRGADRA